MPSARTRSSPSSTTGSPPTILAVRDRVIDRWMESTRSAYRTGAKRVYYLSLEFLIGRLLRDAHEQSRPDRADARRRCKRLGVDLDVIEQLEPDAALGNGGLGRLAACFMESMATRAASPPTATASATSTACSARRSTTAGRSSCPRTGWRTAIPGSSSAARSPTRSASAARVEPSDAGDGAAARIVWQPAEKVARRRLRHADRRLARQAGEHAAPVERPRRRPDPARRLQRAATISARSPSAPGPRRITRVLYPADSTPAGQELRLRQEYFFASASLQDLVRRHIQQYRRRSRTSPTRSRSSSTTPIRRSPSPS